MRLSGASCLCPALPSAHTPGIIPIKSFQMVEVRSPETNPVKSGDVKHFLVVQSLACYLESVMLSGP